MAGGGNRFILPLIHRAHRQLRALWEGGKNRFILIPSSTELTDVCELGCGAVRRIDSFPSITNRAHRRLRALCVCGDRFILPHADHPQSSQTSASSVVEGGGNRFILPRHPQSSQMSASSVGRGKNRLILPHHPQSSQTSASSLGAGGRIDSFLSAFSVSEARGSQVMQIILGDRYMASDGGVIVMGRARQTKQTDERGEEL